MIILIQEERPAAHLSVNDLIYAQVKDLSQRMDRLERRQEKLEEKMDGMRREFTARMDKQDDKIEKLADKIDKLAGKIDAAQSHGQIATISSVGVGLSAVSITLGVLYSLIFK